LISIEISTNNNTFGNTRTHRNRIHFHIMQFLYSLPEQID
jgi:hypothetical protein